MKTIELSREKLSFPDVLTIASHENLIVRTSEGREFLIAEVDDMDREIQLIRENAELMAFLDKRSQEMMTSTLAQVRQHLGLN
ncbi:MAG: hypothetical protein AB1422_10040 [bacterium]